MQVDIELTIINASSFELVKLTKIIPSGYFVEDATERGWGLSIRSLVESHGQPEELMKSFLHPLHYIVCNELKKYNMVLRVVIFFSTACCTVRINQIEFLSDMQLALEISTYPTASE